MPTINWKPDLSLGNVLTILTTVITLVTAWTALQARVEAQDLRAATLEKRMAKIEEEDRKQNAEAQADRVKVTEILSELRTDIRYLRLTFERKGP